MIGVSVIICCYNSSSRLIPTLEHLARQEFCNNISWEVIVVNNASTDNTVTVATEVWRRFDLQVPFKIENQPIQGLSFAREKGIEKAAYEYLLFCDDDNWLHANYIENAFKIMTSNQCIGALGGYGLPYFETNPPQNILKYASSYATGLQRKGTGEVGYPNVYGAGCTYRKSAIAYLFNHGFRYQLTGRNGNILLCGEDHELCYALYLGGNEIWASEQLTFFHFIPNSRISIDYLKKNIMGFAHSSFVLSIYKILITNRERQRPAYKSKWTWVVAVKGMILLKKFKSAFKKDELEKVELIAEKCAFSFLLKNRKLFNKTLTFLANSKWLSNDTSNLFKN